MAGLSIECQDETVLIDRDHRVAGHGNRPLKPGRLVRLVSPRTLLFFEIKGKRVEFEHSVKEAHRKLKTNVFRWLVTDRPQNLITGPLIYGMVVPLLMLDICVSFYQWTCFPIYGIAKVRRSDYLVFDRRHLAYLNIIEKFHCTYCEYGNGLLGYMAEILARTEQYFCPIKHARKILAPHSRYKRFLAYGEADAYEAKLEEFRVALGKEVK